MLGCMLETLGCLNISYQTFLPPEFLTLEKRQTWRTYSDKNLEKYHIVCNPFFSMGTYTYTVLLDSGNYSMICLFPALRINLGQCQSESGWKRILIPVESDRIRSLIPDYPQKSAEIQEIPRKPIFSIFYKCFLLISIFKVFKRNRKYSTYIPSKYTELPIYTQVHY